MRVHAIDRIDYEQFVNGYENRNYNKYYVKKLDSQLYCTKFAKEASCLRKVVLRVVLLATMFLTGFLALGSQTFRTALGDILQGRKCVRVITNFDPRNDHLNRPNNLPLNIERIRGAFEDHFRPYTVHPQPQPAILDDAINPSLDLAVDESEIPHREKLVILDRLERVSRVKNINSTYMNEALTVARQICRNRIQWNTFFASNALTNRMISMEISTKLTLSSHPEKSDVFPILMRYPELLCRGFEFAERHDELNEFFTEAFGGGNTCIEGKSREIKDWMENIIYGGALDIVVKMDKEKSSTDNLLIAVGVFQEVQARAFFEASGDKARIEAEVRQRAGNDTSVYGLKIWKGRDGHKERIIADPAFKDYYTKTKFIEFIKATATVPLNSSDEEITSDNAERLIYRAFSYYNPLEM